MTVSDLSQIKHPDFASCSCFGPCLRSVLGVVEMALPKLLLIPSSRVEMAEMMEIRSDEVVTLKRFHHNKTQ